MKAFIHLYATLIIFRNEKNPEKADALAKELIVMLDQFWQSIPETMLEEIEVQLRNHWTSQYQNNRSEEYLLLMHELQMRQVERLRYNKKAITATQLTNILFAAIKINKIDWAIEVLDWLGPRIMHDNADLIRPILVTHLLFEQKRYSEAAKALPHYITYGELRQMAFYTIAAKLDIKICYELNCLLEEEHENMFRATQIRLRRDRSLTLARREHRERFFPLVMKLFRAKDQLQRSPNANVEKKIQEVQNALNDSKKPVIDADWLQAKVDEFGILKTGNK